MALTGKLTLKNGSEIRLAYSSHAGEEKAVWYTLFAHAWKVPKIWVLVIFSKLMGKTVCKRLCKYRFISVCSVQRERYDGLTTSSNPSPRVVDNGEATQEPVVTAVIPYVAGMSEDIRRICRRHNIRVAFRSSRTLRSMLSTVKDKVPTEKQSDVSIRSPAAAGRCI